MRRTHATLMNALGVDGKLVDRFRSKSPFFRSLLGNRWPLTRYLGKPRPGVETPLARSEMKMIESRRICYLFLSTKPLIAPAAVMVWGLCIPRQADAGCGTQLLTRGSTVTIPADSLSLISRARGRR